VRKINIIQAIVLILCLAGTGFLVTLKPVSDTTKKSEALSNELLPLSHQYKTSKNRLSLNVIEALNLDDYMFQTYSSGAVPVTLYVGYYFSGEKIGAAHDPQVCYPGQGWTLSNKKQKTFHLKDGEKINYSSIIAELDGKKELIVYWFQIDSETADNTLSQKIFLFKNKLFQHGESSAFVRISTPLNDTTLQNAEKSIHNFIEDFYPLFLKYIKND